MKLAVPQASKYSNMVGGFKEPSLFPSVEVISRRAMSNYI